MTRYILIFASLLLAADKFTDKNLTGPETVTGRVIYSLAYAFAPAIIALVLASLKRIIQRLRDKPSTFQMDWNWMWGILLVLLIAVHFIPQITR